METIEEFRGVDFLRSERSTNHRCRVDAIESAIKKELQQVEIKEVNYFSKGVYAREIFIPKGTVITGKIHKYDNLNIMSAGDMSVLIEDGSVVRVKAPYTVVSPPGTRRVAYAHEDTTWTTIHGTDQKDVDLIESEFIAKTPEEFALFCEEQLKLKE